MLIEQLRHLVPIRQSFCACEGFVDIEVCQAADGFDYLFSDIEKLFQQSCGERLTLLDARCNETRSQPQQRTQTQHEHG